MNDNKLIAEFMGHKTNWGFNKDSILYMPHGEGNSSSNSVSIPYNKLQYHTSWDWLMPVIEKCLVGEAEQNEEISTTTIKNIYEGICNQDISHAYKSVVEFIKTYNKTS